MTITNSELISGFFTVTTSAGTNRDAVLIDSFTSQAPLMRHVQWCRTNKPLGHNFQEVTSVDRVDTFDLDGVLPSMKATFKLGQANITPLGGRMEIGEDSAGLMGGADGYCREQSILLAREAGMKLEQAFFSRLAESSHINFKPVSA